MKKIKQILVMVMVISTFLMLCAMPVSAKTIGSLTYEIKNGGVEITDCSYWGETGTMNIPENIEGYPVTSIGSNAFRNCYGFTSIIIPNSVRSIGDYAFSYCDHLTSITIPSNVTSIGNDAFSYCSRLTSITIPNSVTSIGNYAFKYCKALTSIAIPNSVRSIGDYAFHACDSLTSITIPNSVTRIGNGVFYGSNGLTSITIPNSVTSIGDDAFSYCPKLTIYGNSGSVAESYAKSKNIPFKSNSFSDVPTGIWYEVYVVDLVSKGILNGKGDNMFDPNGNIKRCEFAKILATASGEDLKQYDDKTSFADVDANIWYAQYVEWAFKHEIVKGKGAGFAPGENISRQEMAVMIKRYAVYKKVTLAKTTAAITFNDDAQIADWAKEAVSLMQQAGIIGGKPGNVFDPSGSATRAEAAKMISKFLKF